jgi:flagellar motor switch protein FliG
VLIGSEKAAGILANLDEDQVEKITREIATIGGVTPQEATALYAEFYRLLGGSYSISGDAPVIYGGPDVAMGFLKTAFGEDKAQKILLRSVPDAGTTLGRKYFSFLENLDSSQINFLLNDESSATAALVLSRLDPTLAAKVLAASKNSEWKTDVAMRIARLNDVTPEVLQTVAESLRNKAEKASTGNEGGTLRVNGMEKLAAILNAGNLDTGEKIVESIAAQAPDLGEVLKEKLYTEELVVAGDDRKIADKLRTMDERSIVLLINNSSDAFRDKILSHISASRRALVREEESLIGAVPKKEVEDIKRSFLNWFTRTAGFILTVP